MEIQPTGLLSRSIHFSQLDLVMDLGPVRGELGTIGV